jgi:hypothetical protein
MKILFVADVFLTSKNAMHFSTGFLDIRALHTIGFK